MKHPEKAKTHFEQSLKIDPDFTDAADVLKAIEEGMI